MFERYTEKARRVIFFARYEASQYGSPYIDTEHLLLGLLREERALAIRFLRQQGSDESIRTEIEARITFREPISTSVEVPLSAECRRILHRAAEEAERLGHKHIGTEHLLLGMLREEKCFAAEILKARGLTADSVAGKIKEGLGTPSRSGPASIAPLRLDSFLSGFKSLGSNDLIDFFSKNAVHIDLSGRRWTREEMGKGFNTLFAQYAKKNATYAVESTIGEARALFIAIVLWKNALLASEERAWMHRMSLVLVPEDGDWKILLSQVTAVQPFPPPTA